jgi:hypothetical protein
LINGLTFDESTEGQHVAAFADRLGPAVPSASRALPSYRTLLASHRDFPSRLRELAIR